MSDKKEEKSEWNGDILVPLDGLNLEAGKKEDGDYDNGPQEKSLSISHLSEPRHSISLICYNPNMLNKVVYKIKG